MYFLRRDFGVGLGCIFYMAYLVRDFGVGLGWVGYGVYFIGYTGYCTCAVLFCNIFLFLKYRIIMFSSYYLGWVGLGWVGLGVSAS